ncbi:MAG TPA: PilZ domain-containing protein [Thermodesulfobacteriota bacterium]|jgi:c-di-GMP-binding flagellar brake protein YcgR|nr:PilZ domain-containing protein [Thermodesulfobacteriota bacterium]
MREEEKKNRPRYGTVNFEKRKHPRFDVDLPIEYVRTGLVANCGEALNASEGGLLVYFPEEMEVGQHLSLKLFFSSGSELTTIETLVQVVWTDIHLGQDRQDYRAGLKFADISPGDLEMLRNFLRSLSGEVS